MTSGASTANTKVDANVNKHINQAMALIRAQRTMVLATGTDAEPWAAPVYYVYSNPGFYFFSSPKARHIEQALAGGTAAAAIFYDSDQWEQIQGIQMSGSITLVRRRGEQLKAGARFIIKFPFAKPLLTTGARESGAPPQLGDKVKLYAFIPKSAYYVNNQLGFGKRLPIDLRVRKAGVSV
jgi:uncharacterized protein